MFYETKECLDLSCDVVHLVLPLYSDRDVSDFSPPKQESLKTAYIAYQKSILLPIRGFTFRKNKARESSGELQL